GGLTLSSPAATVWSCGIGLGRRGCRSRALTNSPVNNRRVRFQSFQSFKPFQPSIRRGNSLQGVQFIQKSSNRSKPSSILPRNAGKDRGGGLNVLNYLNHLNGWNYWNGWNRAIFQAVRR